MFGGCEGVWEGFWAGFGKVLGVPFSKEVIFLTLAGSQPVAWLEARRGVPLSGGPSVTPLGALLKGWRSCMLYLFLGGLERRE